MLINYLVAAILYQATKTLEYRIVYGGACHIIGNLTLEDVCRVRRTLAVELHNQKLL